jgi:hypothetical protein
MPRTIIGWASHFMSPQRSNQHLGMAKRLVATVGCPGFGLSNQIFAIVHSVFVARRKAMTEIAIGPIRTDFSCTGDPIPTGSVIDLAHLNAYLEPTFGVTMLDAVSEEEHARAENTFGWINAVDVSAFQAILQRIRFREVVSDSWSTSGPCNILHLRMEADALKHWGSMNRVEAKAFESILAAKYIGLVDKYLDPKVPVLVVTDVNFGTNPVIQHMQVAGFTLWTVKDKAHVRGRELRAIKDCAVAIACRGETLIGAFNLDNLNGSTFSYVLWHLSACSRAVMLDPDHIELPEKVTIRG